MRAEENLIRLLGNLGDATDKPITADDVEVCRCVPVVNKPSQKNIIIPFTQRAKRKTMFESCDDSALQQQS